MKAFRIISIVILSMFGMFIGMFVGSIILPLKLLNGKIGKSQNNGIDINNDIDHI